MDGPNSEWQRKRVDTATVPTLNLEDSTYCLNRILRYRPDGILSFSVWALHTICVSITIGAWRLLTDMKRYILPSTILIPVISHPPYNSIGSSTVPSFCHVPDANRSRSFLTFPSCLLGCLEILPEADQRRRSRPSDCFPVAIVQFH